MKTKIFLLALFILTACSEDFLELYPETTLNEGNFYKTEAEYILLANGCYIPLRDYGKTYFRIAELPSDNSSFQYNSTEGGAMRSLGVIDMFVVEPDNGEYANFYNLSYNGITRCNKLLNEIDRPGVTWSKTSYKERCAGEASFLRALYYFNLVQQFGGVPLILKPITSKEAVGIKRSTVEQVYEVIINDLKDAIAHFPNAMDVQENGRANWGAATALLGKVYLTLHQYADAQIKLKALIDSSKYALLPNYADVFNPSKKDYKETIFAIQYSEASVALSNKFIFYFVPYTSKGDVTKRPSISVLTTAGWNQPTDDLINTFEPGDLRKNVSIGFWTGPDWDGVVRAIPYCAKYKPPISAPDDRCSDNLPIIRYSDVLLMYAEVLNELGRTAEAIPYVQQVRNRVGLTAPLTGYTKATLETLIAHERQVELCFENHRWYDLKRTGKAIEVMTAHGAREKAKKPWLYPNSFEMTTNKLLAPIPLLQITLNGLEQNLGY